MNRVHKTVWSQSLGQWVVASEMAKSHGKSQTQQLKAGGAKKSVDFSEAAVKCLGSLAVGAGLALGISPVWAATCTTTAAGILQCQQSTAGEELNYNETGLTAPIYVLGTLVGGEAPVSLVVNDSTITGGTSGHGVTAQGKGASLIFNGTNSITLNTANDTAALVMGSSGGPGDASITVNGQLDINIDHAGVTNSDGLETHGENTSIIHHGEGTITTNGGNAIYTTATNRAEVVIDGSAVNLIVSGDSNNGIRASGQEVVVDIANTSMTTSGNGGNGIYATTTAGSIEITSTDSAITTTGDSAFAIQAQITNAGAASGGITINQTGGTFNTSGTFGHGIHASTNAASGDINVNMTDTVMNLKNYNSDGIYIQNTNAGVSDVNVNVTTNGGAINLIDPNVAATAGSNFGIVVQQSGTAAGDITIHNNGTQITTGLAANGSASNSSAIRAEFLGNAAASGNIEIVNSGTLSTQGASAYGIHGVTAGTGSIDITNTGDITTMGSTAYAVFAQVNHAGAASGGITINQVGGTIKTSGTYAHGLGAGTNAVSGDIHMNMTDTVMTLGNGAGIAAENSAPGASDVNVNITTNGGVINLIDPNIAATSGLNYGIIALQSGVAAGDITIHNNGTQITSGLAANGAAPNASAIYATYANAAATGNIEIVNSGALSTQGANAYGIYGVTAGTGNIDIINTGAITTQDAKGIFVQANTGDATVTASGDITTGQATATSYSSHGIDAGSNSGNSTVNYDSGTIKVTSTNAIGIAAWDRGSTNSSVQAYINLGSGAVIDATEGVVGLQIRSNGTGEINIASGAQVHGGRLGGVQLTGTGTGIGSYTLNNAGEIDAMSDQAILSSAPAGSTLSITNDGTITGYITGGAEDTTFTNNSSNSWNLRNFADTDADGVRDTKAVAVSDFGAGNDTYINTATGTLRLATVSGETTTVTTGEYVPVGALSSSNAGIVHGQLLNLNSFENAGTIDLSANGLAGDVLVITGGTTPGSYGSGQYISNGGNLRIDNQLSGAAQSHTSKYDSSGYALSAE
ncbi:ESPR-type extended signal peptide-containing protein, partial [Saezia sanguinis]|uniref:ESPR-type extended signal peptide-containing protein n=1 Tax=Saezia sanguinis TaxID=1965230 RepID=UPI0011D03854